MALTKTSWGKGKSGNPSGRPPNDSEVKLLAKAHTVEAVEKLIFWMRNGDGRESIAAAKAILDRGWGKPAQELTLSSAEEKPVQLVIDIQPVQ